VANVTTGVYLTNERRGIDRATRHPNIYPASRIIVKNVVIFGRIDKNKSPPP